MATPTTFAAIAGWLSELGYKLASQHTQKTDNSSFEFSKGGTRVIVYFPKDRSVYCKVHTSVTETKKYRGFTISSVEFQPHDTETLEELAEQQESIKKEIGTSKTVGESLFDMWLYLFIFVTIILIFYFIMGRNN